MNNAPNHHKTPLEVIFDLQMGYELHYNVLYSMERYWGCDHGQWEKNDDLRT
jgi:hypothetical protein